jgi:hypothetical protein
MQCIVTERIRAYGCDLVAGDLASALLAQRTEVDGGPGAIGPPRLREFGEAAAGAVLLGDLGVQPAFVMRQRVGGVRAAEHDQFGSERAKSLDLLHALDGLAGVQSTQRRPVQNAVERCLGDRSQVLTFTARKIQVEPGQGARRLDEARLAFEKMLTYANHVGLYAEQIGRAGQQQGNFPRR